MFTRLTYQSGYIASARFSPDGKTIVYGAGIAGNPVEIYTTRSDAPQSRPLGFNHTTVLAISKGDEMAIAVDQRAIAANSVKGTLAQVPLTGGAPRELLEDVRYADWSPDGTELAVVREVGGRDQLEYPLGQVLYQTDGWISHTRVSPDGARVAFIDHPVTFDSRGAIALVDRNGEKTVLTQMFSDVLGLAWHPTGKEIWFTGAAEHLSSSLLAVTLAGKQRTVWSAVGGVVLQDISHNGRVLLTRNNRRRGIAGLFPGHDRETDLSWFDWSLPLDMSADGKWITFSEQGDSAGPKYSAYMRTTDGSPAIRLGEGTPTSLSPDGKWVASIIPGEPQRLLILPTRAGESRDISAPGFSYGNAYWLDDGKRLVVLASQNGQPYRFWIQDATGGRPRPATPEGVVGVGAWPGQKLIIATRHGKATFYPIDSGPPQVPTDELPADLANAASRDDRYLYGIRCVGEVPAKVLRYDRVTGRTEPWKELAPTERAGVYWVGPIIVAPGGRYYAYSYVRDLADLYMVEGLR